MEVQSRKIAFSPMEDGNVPLNKAHSPRQLKRGGAPGMVKEVIILIELQIHTPTDACM